MVSDTLGVATGANGAAADERLLIEFELAKESYGVDISTVREIIRMQQVTRVPGVPDVVEGIINLRGVVVPIVDLRKRLGVTVTQASNDSRVIVTEIDDALVGVLVDAVTGVIRLSSENLQALSRHARTSGSDYLEGVAQFDERLVVLVNIVRALERESLQQVKWDGEVVSTTAEPAPIVAESEAREEPEAAPEEHVADESADEEPSEGLPLQIELLETSFEAVKPAGEELVAYFYDLLFERHPGVQPLFANADMQEQQGKLLSALALVVANLRKPDVLVPALQELGRKHVAYGAEPAHYDAVGAVLLDSLAAIAGDVWTDELRDAWAEAYGLAASVMIEAASEVEAVVETADQEPAEPIEFAEARKAVEKKQAAAKNAPTSGSSSTRKPAAKSTARKAPSKRTTAKKSTATRKRAAS